MKTVLLTRLLPEVLDRDFTRLEPECSATSRLSSVPPFADAPRLTADIHAFGGQ
jgi:hypothetical protein